MNKLTATLAVVLLMTPLFFASCDAPSDAVTWHSAPRVMSGDARYDMGVSAMYAGAVGDVMVIAGGANFPDTPASEGGRKAFYDHIYMYDGHDWQRAGSLPAAAAYGVSFTLDDGLVIAGGANESGALKKVYMLEIANYTLAVTEYPELPCAVEQAAGAAMGESLYLFGGIADGQPSAALYVLDTRTNECAAWRRLASAPEPFVQPIAAASDGRLYVWGGFDSATKSVGGNGYCYDPQRDEWIPVAAHPDGGTFTGGCALTLADGRILCTGGVDREIFAAALLMPAEKSREYLTQPIEAYRFQPTMRLFDPVSGEWSGCGDAECAARAGASLVGFDGSVWLLGGELKPGIRTADNFYTTDFN